MADDEHKVIRVFVAIEISDEARKGLKKAQDGLRNAKLRVKWVEPENLHLTLLFLGNTFERKALHFAERLDSIATDTPQFRYDVTGLGFFGSRRSPRIVWAGVSAPPELIDLYSRISDAAVEMDYATERRKFKGHVTLARIRSSKGTADLIANVNDMSGIQFGRVFVDSLLFIKSELTPQGPIYTVLRKSELAG
jgi:2'-5' RNA ligase